MFFIVGYLKVHFLIYTTTARLSTLFSIRCIFLSNTHITTTISARAARITSTTKVLLFVISFFNTLFGDFFVAVNLNGEESGNQKTNRTKL